MNTIILAFIFSFIVSFIIAVIRPTRNSKVDFKYKLAMACVHNGIGSTRFLHHRMTSAQMAKMRIKLDLSSNSTRLSPESRKNFVLHRNESIQKILSKKLAKLYSGRIVEAFRSYTRKIFIVSSSFICTMKIKIIGGNEDDKQ